MSQKVMDMLVNHEQEILKLRQQRDALLESLREVTRIADAASMTMQLGKNQLLRIAKAKQAIKECESGR